MTTLTNHLQQHGPSMFDGADYNEIVLLLYLFLSDAIRDAATEFTLSPVKCSWANTTSRPSRLLWVMSFIIYQQ